MKKHKHDTSPRVHQRDKFKGSLAIKPFPWTDKQKKFIELAQSKDSRIIFVNGPAGSAKTLLATYVSLVLLDSKRVSDITYIRSAVESADSKLGYLPGEVDEKVFYYGIPFRDKLDELMPPSAVNALADEERISTMPVNYIRGQSWNAKAIIVDEAQNLTDKELVTVLTRIGKYSKCFVLADPMQSDINGKSGGFVKMCDLFGDAESQANGISVVTFEESDIMRDELTKFLVKKFKGLKR